MPWHRDTSAATKRHCVSWPHFVIVIVGNKQRESPHHQQQQQYLQTGCEVSGRLGDESLPTVTRQSVPSLTVTDPWQTECHHQRTVYDCTTATATPPFKTHLPLLRKTWPSCSISKYLNVHKGVVGACCWNNRANNEVNTIQSPCSIPFETCQTYLANQYYFYLNHLGDVPHWFQTA